MGSYIFDHEWEQERERLRQVETLFDPGTIGHLEALGVRPGWRCLEVGGGGGSITRWLCQRVGPTGRVVATDLQTDFLEQLTEPNLEVRRHDIAADELEEGAFDLVHSRMCLQHVPGRDLALKRMAAALAPGGVLLDEDMDCCSLVAVPSPGAELFNRTVPAVFDAMVACGYDPYFGRRLPAALRAAGLSGVEASAWAPVVTRGSVAAKLWELTAERARPAAVGSGEFTDADYDRFVALTDDEEFAFVFPLLVSAWGFRRG
jgi:SAM-dependent methyltransferase